MSEPSVGMDTLQAVIGFIVLVLVGFWVLAPLLVIHYLQLLNQESRRTNDLLARLAPDQPRPMGPPATGLLTKIITAFKPSQELPQGSTRPAQRQCAECGEWKPASEFTEDSERCRACVKALASLPS